MSSNSSDDEPLAKKIKKKIPKEPEDKVLHSKFNDSIKNNSFDTDFFSGDEFDDSDCDPNFIGQCEYKKCNGDIFDPCIYCEAMFCAKHHENHKPCFKQIPKKKINPKFQSNKVQTTVLKKTTHTKPSIIEDETNQHCEVKLCTEEVFAACHRCLVLLCWTHFENNESCKEHFNDCSMELQEICDDNDVTKKTHNRPEDYLVEGGEDQHKPKKSPRKNKRKIAKTLRNSGKEYVSSLTKKLVPEKKVKQGCNSDICKRFGKNCNKIDEEGRLEIFTSFYDLGNLQIQREFISRHIETSETKQKTTNKNDSRRKHSMKYYLTYKCEKIAVCKTFFLATLSITERTVRTALGKITPTGIIEPDRRGGRKNQSVIELDERNAKLIEDHIDRFPFVESHYCRSETSRNYLHEDLTLSKMYSMFVDENKDIDKIPSKSSYRRIFIKKKPFVSSPQKRSVFSMYELLKRR